MDQIKMVLEQRIFFAGDKIVSHSSVFIMVPKSDSQEHLLIGLPFKNVLGQII